MGTKEKIVVKALEMFNERGIEYVGLRELAAVLGMRVSNITYYFPTKDDLVYAIAQELSRSNAAVIVERDRLTMRSFLEMMHQVFQNHVTFRCLLLSVVHLMAQNKYMAAAYQQTQNVRNATMRANLEILRASGYLTIQEEGELSFLVSALSLISRFWISEAAVSFREMSTEEQIDHYLTLVTNLLRPYCSSKAKKEMQEFLSDLQSKVLSHQEGAGKQG
ncbi:hypothetical protein GCM10023189_21060 [Nibrella saemangeumensis]|uniref:HTH tetR-type domain-containing protein n=1 Tax=Nibrella saemangeumensis TaxID=1084526 RepID=A0ABP8MUL7_9BACT